MTDNFDDDLLRSALDERSGGPVATGAARQATLARSARVRTVRTAVAGGSVAAVMVIGLFALPALRDEPAAVSELPAPSDPVTNSAMTTVPTSTEPSPTSTLAGAGVESTTGAPTTIAVTLPPGVTLTPAATTTTMPGAGGPPSPTSTHVVQPTIPVTTSPTVTPTTTTLPSTTSPDTTSPNTTSPPTTSAPADPPFTRTYDSAGGSITVNWNGSVLSLLAVDPNAGFEPEIEDNSASRIRVRFRGDDDDARIEVRVDDGQVEFEIS